MNTKLLTALIFVAPLFAGATSADDAREQAARIVAQIQRADYEGDRAAMQRGYEDLKPFLEDKELASRIRYWRGFARWRRAINGFNDAVDPKELEHDLNAAIDEFKAVLEQDPKFVDAKIGMISCKGFLLFTNQKDETHRKELIEQILVLAKEASEMAPDNPRLIWVRGPILWNSPPERGGGQDKAMQNYEHGLEICSRLKASDNPLEPSWGKPELMMSLAYCYLNGAKQDVDAAERYARGALEIVPYWHYTRDVLLPQILAAKTKSAANDPNSKSQPKGATMKLGAFSVSLAVKNIAASRTFYQKLGFKQVGGDPTQNWLILRNGDTTIGLFHGMFERNTLTFNPGWTAQAEPLKEFEDVRQIQQRLRANGLTLASEADESTTGPASLTLIDPDGNPILIDQHVDGPQEFKRN